MIGLRHHGACICGCQHVEGLLGAVVENSDTPKLAALGLVVVRFTVPHAAGGRSRAQDVCYTLAEYGSEGT